MTPRQKLFNYFAENHNVMLLDSDFNEIEIILEGYAASKPYSPEVARRLIAIRDILMAGTPINHDRAQAMWDEFKGITKGKWTEMERIAKEK